MAVKKHKITFKSMRQSSVPLTAQEEDRLKVLYDRLPKVACKGLCQFSCTHLAMIGTEVQEFRKRGIPLPTQNPVSGLCELLDEQGNCSIYDNRPFVCRAWGATKDMPCVHGCNTIPLLDALQMSVLMSELMTLNDAPMSFYFSAQGEDLVPSVQNAMAAFSAASGFKLEFDIRELTGD